MKAQFLKMGGVTSEAEFYNKFPTEESFFAAYPEAEMMKGGGTFSGNTYYQDGGDSPALWHSEWNEDEFNPYNEQNLDNTVQNNIANQANKKPKKDPNKGLKDYIMINTGLDMTTGLINQFSRREREMNNYMQRQQMADNLYPVMTGNFSGSQGNYAVTGSGYGQFRPDQMGAKSPDGMYNGMFYPQMQEGGEIELTADEIMAIQAAGGEVEFL